MQNQIQVFESHDFGTVRVLEKNGQPWWVLKDVCKALSLSNPTIVAQRLDSDEKLKVDPKLDLGSRSNTPVTVVSESGLYAVILRSDKPEAKIFRRWITHEVLPAIRKTGSYTAKQKRFRSKPFDVIFRQCLNTAKNYAESSGVSLEIALAKGIEDAENLSGHDFSHFKDLLAEYGVKTAQKENTSVPSLPNLNATAVGGLVGMSARDVNKLLELKGLHHRTANGRRITEKGKEYGSEFTYINCGEVDYYVLWHSKVADAIKE
jgi:prophage antirepressor-like protein